MQQQDIYIILYYMGVSSSWSEPCLRLQSVRAIGRCAVSLEHAAERCINVLLELIKTKVNYVVQEAIVVIKDIFRRYPNRCRLLSPVEQGKSESASRYLHAL